MDYKQFLRPGKGATDITPLFNSSEVFESLIEDLAKLFEGLKIDKVAAIEGRGFMLGAPVAYKLKTGLVPIRSAGKLKNEVFTKSYTDYSGKEKVLEIHRDAIKSGERVLLIDDWVETGATNKAAIRLIEKCGGEVVGIGALMDDSKDELREEFKKYNYKYLDKVISGDKF